MATNESLTWFPVNLTDKAAAKAYEAFQEANKAARAKREALEAILKPKAQAKAPEGHEPVFSYRFGKISVAFRPKAEKAAGGSKASEGIAL